MQVGMRCLLRLSCVLGPCPGPTFAQAIVEGRVELPKSHFAPVMNKRYEIVTRGGVLATSPPIAVVYLEADDLHAAFEGLGSSEEPFDVWFRGHVRDVHGIDLAQGFPPPEQAVDFRR